MSKSEWPHHHLHNKIQNHAMINFQLPKKRAHYCARTVFHIVQYKIKRKVKTRRQGKYSIKLTWVKHNMECW